MFRIVLLQILTTAVVIAAERARRGSIGGHICAVGGARPAS